MCSGSLQSIVKAGGQGPLVFYVSFCFYVPLKNKRGLWGRLCLTNLANVCQEFI